MQGRIFKWTARTIAVVVLTAGVGVHAQSSGPGNKTLSGLINAYTPQTTSATGTITGPWEIRGPWSLTLKEDGRKADFSASLNMEFSDGWVLSQPVKDFTPALRSAHTHHITLVDADVILIANGFQVTGIAAFTKDGNPAPSSISPSTLVIQITGGTDVEYSNITMTFQSPGSTHFGPAPLPGVVRIVK